jgi:hypothetical protein
MVYGRLTLCCRSKVRNALKSLMFFGAILPLKWWGKSGGRDLISPGAPGGRRGVVQVPARGEPLGIRVVRRHQRRGGPPFVSRRQPRRAGSPATATPAGPSGSGHRPRGPSASRSAAYASTRRRTSRANGASASLRTKILKANYALGKLSQAVGTLVTVQFAFRNGYKPQWSISCPPRHEHPLRGFRRVFVGIKDDISSPQRHRC